MAKRAATNGSDRLVVESYMPPALYEMIRGLEAAVPHITAAMLKSGEDFDRLTIRQRSAGDWSLVLKSFDDSGTPVVCFGNGYDFWSGLLGLEASVKSGKWRPDKPWSPT